MNAQIIPNQRTAPPTKWKKGDPYPTKANRHIRGAPDPTPVKVTITDLDIKFGTMVLLLVKMAFAAIPAFMIIAIIIGTLTRIIAAG